LNAPVAGLAVDASLLDKAASEPGVTFWPGMSLAETRLLARWCPAWRRREPGLRLSCGTWESAPRYCLPGEGGERETPKRLKREGLSTDPGAQADRPVVAVKPLLDAVGAERRGRLICGSRIRSTGEILEESGGRAGTGRQAV
jgi:hypothetical protein